jgi:phosphoglycolate phosphatase
VLSGVTTEEKLLSPENTITPDYYTDTINDFFAEVPAATEA